MKSSGQRRRAKATLRNQKQRSSRTIPLIWGSAALASWACSGTPGSPVEPFPRFTGWPPALVPDTTAPAVATVVEDEGFATQIAVDERRIYWMTTSTGDRPLPRVRSCEKDDCTSTIVTYEWTIGAVLNAGAAENYALAVGGNHVAWTHPGAATREFPTFSILTCPSEGCRGAPTAVASDVQISALAIDETHVYWASSRDTAILRRDLTGTGRTEVLALNETGGGQLRVDRTSAYWISSLGKPNAMVKRVVKQGGEVVQTLVAEQNQAAALAIDSDFFYWANAYSVGTISRCPLTGCVEAPTQVIGKQNRPRDLVTDGKTIFWTKVDDQPSASQMRLAVMRCPLDDCASGVESLAMQTLPEVGVAMAVDDRDVYWVAPRYLAREGAGLRELSTIYRHPKSAPPRASSDGVR